MVSQGKRYDLAKDSSVKTISTQGWAASGLAKDTSVTAISGQAGWVTSGLAKDSTAASSLTQLQTGVPPAVSGTVGGDVILQGPGGSPYTIYTFTGNGRIWVASVSLNICSSGATGSNQIYARVYVVSGRTLAYCEAGIVGNPAQDSNGDSNTYPGISVLSGAVVKLDINNGASVTGAVIRGGGIFVGSIP